MGEERGEFPKGGFHGSWRMVIERGREGGNLEGAFLRSQETL